MYQPPRLLPSTVDVIALTDEVGRYEHNYVLGTVPKQGNGKIWVISKGRREKLEKYCTSKIWGERKIYVKRTASDNS